MPGTGLAPPCITANLGRIFSRKRARYEVVTELTWASPVGLCRDSFDQTDAFLLEVAMQIVGLGPDVVSNQQMHTQFR